MPRTRTPARGRAPSTATRARSRSAVRSNSEDGAPIRSPDDVASSAEPASPTLSVTAEHLRTMVREILRDMAPAAMMGPPHPASAAGDLSTAEATPVSSDFGAADNTGTVLSVVAGDEDVTTVAATLRQRIVTDRYVDLGMLLDSEERAEDDRAPTFQLVDGLLRPAARTPRTITSFGSWSLAFLRYTSIYLDAHPSAAAGLLSHMRQVGQLAAPGLGLAWRNFDESFRKAREVAPERHQWGGTPSSSALWLQAVARGVGGANRLPAGASRNTPIARFRFCYGYNLPRGCTNSPCRFVHICSSCRGPHPATRCPRRQPRLRPRPGPVVPAKASH